jgi:predicted signal transduction protein with EAL and GGDEF domain
MGGDEYAVVDSPHDGAGLAERLLVAVRQPFTAAGRAIHLDASVGIAELEVTPGEPVPADPDRVAVDLLRDADSAMYAAKSAGGGIQRFEDDLRRTMLDRVALGRELRDALIRGDELALAYQPVVHLPSGRVLHVEALARWTSPRRGAVPPGVFIPIAESSGLMPLLGRWVLRTACTQTAAWNRQG